MSSFNDEDEVRIPDEVYNERLVDDFSDSQNINQNNDDLEIALQKSMETYLSENHIESDYNGNIEVEDEYEKIIHQSIIDECDRIERIKEREEKLKIEEEKIIKEKYEKENTLFISKKEEKYKYFINKLTYIIRDKTNRNNIIQIIKKYIYASMDERFIYISNTDYELFNKFMNYIYVIPQIQNRRSPISKDDAEELIKSIRNKNEIMDFYYANHDETYIKEINNYFDVYYN
jgi:hypothetical protein